VSINSEEVQSASTSFVEATRWGELNTATINGTTQRTSVPKRLRQTFQVLRSDLDQAMPWTIDIGYQKEGSRNGSKREIFHCFLRCLVFTRDILSLICRFCIFVVRNVALRSCSVTGARCRPPKRLGD
jgi:hypothetical protein